MNGSRILKDERISSIERATRHRGQPMTRRLLGGGCIHHLQSGAFRVCPGFDCGVVLADTTATLAVAADSTSEHGLDAAGISTARIAPAP
jgi:hypothetical protein